MTSSGAVMDVALKMTLALERDHCVVGESVPFRACITNASPETLTDVRSAAPHNRSIELEIIGPAGRFFADALSGRERDGFHHEAPREFAHTTLRPGAALAAEGDLLEWFGELPVGEYEFRAYYRVPRVLAQSNAVKLLVQPASAGLLATPRCGARLETAPVSLLWGQARGAEIVLFSREQSSYLPVNPWHGFAVAQIAKPLEIFPVTAARPEVPLVHALWLDRRGRLLHAAVQRDRPKIDGGIEIKAPFHARPLASPLAVFDGSLFVPVTDNKKERLAVLHVPPRGGVRAFELDLARHKPIGPYVCFWEYERFLHFAWARSGGWDVQYARLALAHPESGFACRGAHLSSEPILALEAFLDLEAPLRDRLALEERGEAQPSSGYVGLPPPPLVLWCASAAAGQLVITRVNVAENTRQPVLGLPCGTPEGLRPCRSAVTSQCDLALLLADAAGELYYASTARRALAPLRELSEGSITWADCPGLLPAGAGASRPLVYLTYLDRREAGIKYVRLEPAG